MRVICVVDNAVQRSSLFWGEHGLSFLIEAEGKRLLYDTGRSGTVLLHNLEVLGVEPATIDAIALSHAHNDHAGGIAKLMDYVRSGTPLYAHLDLFRERFSKKGEEIQNKAFSTTRQTMEAQFDLRLHEEPLEVIPGVWTTGGILERPEPEGKNADHLMREGEAIVPDAYQDDMALVLQNGNQLMLLCGCCHAGLLNTLAHVEQNFSIPVAFIAGGLHLTAYTSDQLDHVCEVLSSHSTLQRVYPNHCTGEVAFVSLTNALGASVVQPCPAGAELDWGVLT
jgi:7,8-dihydropterin-6-yl-methyl-4-(beta-D-ribofuranosyl)aminobenzene 5'-phosphate synthase